MKTASIPFVRRQRGAVALGGQQAQRLQQLRHVSESHIHEQHLQPSADTGGSPRTRNGRALSPVVGHSARASRTVEAVIESRYAAEDGDSKVSRLRKTVRDARGGIQTERSDRPRTTTTPTVQHSQPSAARPVTQAAHTQTQGMRQVIGTARRRVGAGASSARKLTREELEWIEKQLQFSQRVGLLERECQTWWQSFYSSAGSTTSCGDEALTTAMSIQKQIDECDQRRLQDARDLQNQLNTLRDQADNVMHMVHAMRDGTQFIHDLQEAMDAFELALGAFRVTQREKFDSYVLEEKLLDRDLGAFLGKIESWEQQDLATKQHAKSTTDRRRVVGARRRVVESEPIGLESDRPDQPRLLDLESGTDSTKSELDLIKLVRSLNAQILQSGGLKGGWDDRDHAVFASTLLKCGLTDEVLMLNHSSLECSNQDNSAEYETLVARFLRKCFKVIVTKSENAVRNHFDWYLSHLQLLHEKKVAIQQWKQRKESERQQLIKQGLYHTEEAGAGLEVEIVAEQTITEEQQKRRALMESKEREEQARKLDEWRKQKQKRTIELREQEREQRAQQDAIEAKKRQKLLEKKQQVLLYKLQREQEASTSQRRLAPFEQTTQSSPVSNEELLERSRKALELAKTKRAQLQAIEERRLKQSTLPERPKSVTRQKSSAAASPTDSEGSPSTREATLLKPTKAHEARQLTKLELKQREKQRTTQGAHDAYFPGAGVVSDVKIKSFGHTAIAPRAVPSWRRNI